jgi:diguanylate cyclase (GGDEF)-like protein
MNPERRSRSRYLASLALLSLAYFAAAKLGLRLAYLNPSATAVWPPAGIALGALLVLGYRMWPAIALGAFVANVTTAGSLATSLGISVGNTAEALAGTWLVNRFANGRHAMERPKDILMFALLAAGASTIISASVGVTSLSLGGFLEAGTYREVGLTWWLGDLVGDVLVAPLILVWSTEATLHWTPAQVAEAALLLLAVVVGGQAMFGGLLPPYPITFLYPPLLLWPAFRFGLRESATVSVILGAIAVAGTLRGFGSFARESPNESLLLLQCFMGVSALTAVAVAALVAERKQLEARLSHLADHDSLTEVLSRRRFQEKLEQQLAQARRYATTGALLFLDLDDFKSINDRLGHATGDQVLRSVATRLRGRLRDSDVVGRLGGDEFVVLLPLADGAQAEAVAAQLLRAIGSRHMLIDGNLVDTTASIGIALIPGHGTHVDELMAHADAAMFQAKSAGGNRSRTFAPDSP